MNVTLALDGTHGIVARPEEMVGARARGLSETWRES